MIFIDFEASGLGQHSWPIEVGLARVEGPEVCVEARLIRPAQDWDLAEWSPESAQVHGITLEELARAEPAEDVARWVAGRIEEQLLISDAPEFDGHWMARLLAAAPGLSVPRLVDFDRLVVSRCTLAQTRRVYATLDDEPAPHRAGPDAERLARAWLAGQGAGT